MSKWMCPQEAAEPPMIVLYRCSFCVGERTEIPFRFSADESAQLYFDGKRLIEGPERGSPTRWYYQNAVLHAERGEHVLTARVYSFGKHFFPGQMSVRHGFFCDDPSGTLTDWKYRIERGITFEAPVPDWGCFPRVHVSGDYGTGEWKKTAVFEDTRQLFAPELPLLNYKPVMPEEIRPGLLYFHKYTCAWAHWHFEGKGMARVRWMESPFDTPEMNSSSLKGVKGKRQGQYFIANFDVFEVDGVLDWDNPSWRAGHYIEVVCEGDVKWKAEFHATGYPLPEYHGNDRLIKAVYETLQACSVDIYMDCPYFERLMYVLDSRVEILATYAVTDDHRLPAKALKLFLESQSPDGSIYAQYPSKANQVIPCYNPMYALMLRDYWERHGNDAVVTEVLPAFRRLAHFLTQNITDDGVKLAGWNFIDWGIGGGWNNGVPPGGCMLDMIFLAGINAANDILHEPELEAAVQRLRTLIPKLYYVPEKQLFADDAAHQYFSEHAQTFAVLNGFAEPVRLDAPGLTACSIGFSYYFMEACEKLGRRDLIDNRLAQWNTIFDKGLTTFPEEFGQPRSDCHAWSCYILYFLDQANIHERN